MSVRNHMKMLRWLAAGILVILLAGLVLSRTGRVRTVPSLPRPAVAGRAQESVVAPSQSAATLVVAPAAAAAPGVEAMSVTPPSAVDRFEKWSREFAGADGARRAALMEEGVALAHVRRAEMAQLIRTNPEQAVQRALPYELRQQLPEPVQKLIEQPVHDK